MKITIFQQDTLGLNDSRFALFCYKLEKDTLVLLPEYTLNPFFVELKSKTKKQIHSHTNSQICFLSYLAERHNINFVAPIVRCINKKLYKEIIYISYQNAQKFNQNIQQMQDSQETQDAQKVIGATKKAQKQQKNLNESVSAKSKIDSSTRGDKPLHNDSSTKDSSRQDSSLIQNAQGIKKFIFDFCISDTDTLTHIDKCATIYPFYRQQRLIEYQHWNEARFFDNHKHKILKKPLIFTHNGFNIAVLFGFEVHFDEFWLSMKKDGVDIVLLPCANTFQSSARWRELCKVRAFLNGCVVIRANRVGTSVVNNSEWVFYGDSLIAMPNGEIIDNLRDKEAMLSLEIYKNKILEMAREWGFRKNF